MADKRFARVASDPRFRKVDHKKRKVKIDSRFARMFNDKAFTTKYFVDKRGAIIGKTSKENLRQFYELSDDDNEEPDNNFGKSKKKEKSKRKKDENVIKKKKKKENEQVSLFTNEEISNDDNQCNVNDFQGHKIMESSDEDNDNENENENENNKISEKKMTIDLARGEGNFESSSSEEDNKDEDDNNAKAGSSILKQDFAQENNNTNCGYDTDTDDEKDFQDDGIDHKWAELDSNIHRSSNVTKRLAVCNLDWDKITATDLFVLFSSIIKKGILKSVKIYLSDYGQERLKNEECYGPQELIDGEGGDDDNVEGSSFSKEKLRQYQINRLKYYYAVVECDSKETCNQIYEEFDGVEFELSGNLLDLRFIPNDIDFEQEPTSVAMEMPSVTMYKPPEFETTALHQTNVKMTWDETDARRLKATMKAFKKEDLQDMDFQAYLASDDEDDGAPGLAAGEGDDVGAEDEDENIAKYKKLLQDIDSREHEDDNDNEMEITWEPGLKESAMNLVAKKRAEKEEKYLTAWEKYLNKKKEKKKERRMKEKEQRIKAKQNEEEYIPESVDLSDPFFTREFGPDFPANNNEQVKTKLTGSKKKGKKCIETEEEKKRKEELELLLMDEQEGPKHFSLKGILENEKMNKKPKKKRRELEKADEDPFEVDVDDSRFSALYSSHLYAINPSDPHYRKTKAMDAIFEERQRRRELKAKQIEEQDQNIKRAVSQTKDGKPSKDPSLSLLVKSVKSKTGEFNQRRKKHKTSY